MSVAAMKAHGPAIERHHSPTAVAGRLVARLACLGLILALVFTLRFVMHEHYHGDGASAPASAVDL